MNVQDLPVVAAEPELHLLTEWRDEQRGRRAGWAAAGAILVHIGFYFSAIALNRYLPPPALKPVETVDVRKAIRLIAPRLTQREPNRAEVAKELKLENMLARPKITPAPAMSSPPPSKAAPRPTAPPVLEPPQVTVAQAPPPMAGTTPTLPGPPVPKPPPPAAEEKPKLAFETPGVPSARAAGVGRIDAPKSGVQEALRNAAKSGPGGIAVGDAGAEADAPPGMGQLPGQPGAAPRQASSLELLSDPMGIDFKPYLIRVLAAVRRNWFSVIPESARYGRRGKVVLQFSISRTGTVPKLVIVMPSGTEAFDRAAVAGVSASNPFPPLPANFTGDTIRVQLAFTYNASTR